MAVLIQSDLENLKRRLLILSAEVEERVQHAVLALLNDDDELATKVKGGDNRIDNLEIELEEECLKVLALHQPVANDLRFIVSVLKINNDLERVADFAVNLAERALDLNRLTTGECPYDIKTMANRVKVMLRSALDSLMNQDSFLARTTIKMDDEVDRTHSTNYEKVKEVILAEPHRLDELVLYLSISRYLERMADLATNIAEDVVYQIEGEIIRHGGMQI